MIKQVFNLHPKLIESRMSDFNEKQIHIMEAAEKLFAAKGFEGSSVRDIADAAGVNLAMISYYFGSKEKMMEALFEYRGNFMKLKLENLLADESITPWEKIQAVVDQYLERLLNNPDFYRIMSREQMESSNTMISQKIIEIKSRNIGLLASIMKQGQDNGSFKKSVDVPLLLMTLVGTIGQLLTSGKFYQILGKQTDLTEEEYREETREKLRQHLKQVFKATLLYES